MKLLSASFLLIDTSDRIAMIGIYDGDEILWETRASVGRPSLHWISHCLAEAEQATGHSIKDMKFLACGTGPGGFTSVRIGLSFMKAASQTLKIPILGVNRLEAAALGQALKFPADRTARYVVRLPAARNLEYFAVYRPQPGRLPVCVREPAALDLEAISKIRKLQSDTVVTPDPEIFYLGLPRLAALKASAGKFDSAETLVPLYLRGATLGPPSESLTVARRRGVR